MSRIGSASLLSKKAVHPKVHTGPENVNITTLNRFTGRRFLRSSQGTTTEGVSQRGSDVKKIAHYENMPMQYITIFHVCKDHNFQIKIAILFLVLLKT